MLYREVRPLFVLAALLIPLLAAPIPAHAVTSGAYTEDVKLAVTDFVKNATEAAKDAGMLERGIPCKTKGQTPQQLAANQMRAAVNQMRIGQLGKIFGDAALDAIKEVAKLHPALKGVGTAAGLLKDYLGSKDVGDFAGKVFKDKIKGKATGKLKDAIGEDAYKGAEALYKALDKQLQEQIAKAFANTIKLNSPCGGAGDVFTVKVDMKSRSIEITLAGGCDCSLGGVKSYAGVLFGRVQVRQKKDKFVWRFVLTGMRFTGECCGGATGTPRNWGSVPMPDGKAIKIGNDDYTGGGDCDTVDCKKLHDEFRNQHQRLQTTNRALKGLGRDDPAWEGLDRQATNAANSIKRICEVLNRCCNTKEAPPKDIRELITKYCVKRDFSYFLLPGYGELAPETAFAVSYDRSEWCSYGGDSTPVPTTSTPTGGDPPGGSAPPIPVGVPIETGGGEEGEPITSVPPETTPPVPVVDEPSNEPPTLTVKAKESVLVAGELQDRAVPQAMIKLNLAATPALPLAGNPRDDAGFDEGPVQGLTDDDGNVTLALTGSAAALAAAGAASQMEVDLTANGSTLVHLDPAAGGDPRTSLHDSLHPYLVNSFAIGSAIVAVLTYEKQHADAIKDGLEQSENVLEHEENYCRDKQEPDPFFMSRGTWRQAYDDQWAIHRVGITAEGDSAWASLGEDPKQVIVAVIDTGIDWNHLDLSWDRIWHNPGETPNNGIDDDANGYVDDVIGWDFFAGTNAPFDRDGHGTFVAGLIGASTNNGIGIAGINPHALIMPLKALNDFGHTRASHLAEALVYAADHGAQVINLSVGGKNLTRAERLAIDYAHGKGAIVVAAAGNEAVDVLDWSPAGLEHVIAVGASDSTDAHAVFSNWGAGIDLVAPGTDVLSLRARRSDLMQDIPGVRYEIGEGFVGEDRRYYRASGTSFSAPIVAGVASLLLSKQPSLTPDEVERMLVHSARDIGVPGVDQYTGYGLVDARAALAADPAFFAEARITSVAAEQIDGATVVQITGTADANRFAKAWLEIGPGEDPAEWTRVEDSPAGPVRDGLLGQVPASAFGGAPKWTLRVRVEHEDGTLREARFVLTLG
ncbi:MAG: S8 family serine peptidase [Deltaproteobacteria bacterium]|nr:S8 family serine peptidase [Deltaproteobacteria bacterium]